MKTSLLFILMNLAVTLNAQQALHFRLEVAELTASEKIYNFIVDDYVNVIAWQYVMIFDDSKMQFREIRNSIVEGLSTGTFHAESPGYLRTAGFDPDLDPVDFPDSTVIYQIVFDLTAPGGSTLCFSEVSSDYEIVIEENGFQMELEQLIVTDECNTGLVLNLNPTSVDHHVIEAERLIEKIFLSKQGELAFTTTHDQKMSLQLFDVLGRPVSLKKENTYDFGRNVVNMDKSIYGGIYMLLIRSEDGRYEGYPVIAQ